eukprot:scaffold5043_cov115-Isochrysis_galbana.AAC.9
MHRTRAHTAPAAVYPARIVVRAEYLTLPGMMFAPPPPHARARQGRRGGRNRAGARPTAPLRCRIPPACRQARTREEVDLPAVAVAAASVRAGEEQPLHAQAGPRRRGGGATAGGGQERAEEAQRKAHRRGGSPHGAERSVSADARMVRALEWLYGRCGGRWTVG